MKQNAADIPVHNYQRKAAIANGGVADHAGLVEVSQIPNFDLQRTIFNTLEGRLPRFVIRTRIAKEIRWQTEASDRVEHAYQSSQSANDLPKVDPGLLDFLVTQCDFDVEHADGSFLDHLYFCFEYTHQHYPDHSPLVMLLHSILGTGTNTFAMSAEKMPALRALLTEFEWRHVEAFPSVLRLLYGRTLREELWANKDRLDALVSIKFHRVIDNEPLTMSADDLWIQLNYQLIHLVDFLPVANWSTHANDTAFIVFRDLYDLLSTSGRLGAKLSYDAPGPEKNVTGEAQTLGAKLVSMLPVGLSEKMAAKSVRRFSAQIGHTMTYEMSWRG